ncbi:hypothetical protein, partial [Sphaerotilus sp.]|uniref:hypothetical protein n=1 Tax=Sphaerotilus sp. TaxID=2093942 RepID=UPI0034E222ED
MSSNSSTLPAPAAPNARPGRSGHWRGAAASALAAATGAAGLYFGGWPAAAMAVITFGLLGIRPSGPARPGDRSGAQRALHPGHTRLAEPVVSGWQQLLGNTQRASHQCQRALATRIVAIGQQLESVLNLHTTTASPALLIDDLMGRHHTLLDELLHHSRSTARLRLETVSAA